MEKRIAHIYVYLMLGFYLFFTGFEGYTNIFDSKYVVFVSLSAIYVIASAIFGIRKKPGVAEWSAIAFLVLSAISAFASEHFPRTLVGATRSEGLLTIALYVLVFIFLSQNWETPRSFVPFLAIVMLVESAIVLLQLIDLNVMGLYPRGENYHIALEKYNGAFISTIGNADISSAFFSLMTPVLWGLGFEYKRHRILIFASAILSLLATLMMSVSAGVVALALTLLIALPFTLLPKKKAVLLIVSLLTVLLLVLYLLPIGNGTLFEIHSLLHGKADGDFGSGRLHIWKEVLKNLDNLAFGNGPDTMFYADLEPFTKITGGKTITRKIDIAHNDYLNVLFHQGLFALVAYLGVFTSLFKKRPSPLQRSVRLGIFAYAVQIFFSYSSCPSAIFFWIMLGIMNEKGM